MPLAEEKRRVISTPVIKKERVLISKKGWQGGKTQVIGQLALPRTLEKRKKRREDCETIRWGIDYPRARKAAGIKGFCLQKGKKKKKILTWTVRKPGGGDLKYQDR